MLNITEIMKSLIEAHEDEIYEAIWAQLQNDFNPEEIARNILSNYNINETLAELVTLPF